VLSILKGVMGYLDSSSRELTLYNVGDFFNFLKNGTKKVPTYVGIDGQIILGKFF